MLFKDRFRNGVVEFVEFKSASLSLRISLWIEEAATNTSILLHLNIEASWGHHLVPFAYFLAFESVFPALLSKKLEPGDRSEYGIPTLEEQANVAYGEVDQKD